MEGTLAEIRGFGGNFAPRAWAFCQGQLLSINTNQALFSLLGTTFGGDGRTTFGLPDLRGRVPIGAGQGPGLTNRNWGSRSGTEYNIMTVAQMPVHNHTATLSQVTGVGAITGSATATVNVNNSSGPDTAPSGNFLGVDGSFSGLYESNSDGSTLNAGAVTIDTSSLGVDVSNLTGSITVNPAGGQQSINNMQPYLTIYWVICLQGVFPSRG